MKSPRFSLMFLAPQYWGAWLGILLIRIFSFLSYKMMLKLSVILGKLFFPLAKKRKNIIETNIRLCFPDKTVKEQQQLSQAAFNSTIMALFEIALSWWGSEQKIMKLHQVQGMEYLEEALAKNKGVILLVSHFTTMEVAGTFLGKHVDNLNVVYKRSTNPLLEWFIQRKRLKNCSALLKHKGLRKIVRSIKDGNIVWYAPDQDFGRKDSIFAPFMGVMTNTLLSTQRIAKLTGAPVVPFYVERNKESGYTLHFSQELQNFPSSDDLTDATTVNHAIEEQVKKTPDQYLWAHRRFKTRPIGEADVYAEK